MPHSLTGTIVNGLVQLDCPSRLPDGTRVMLFTDDGLEAPNRSFPSESDWEIALLRESIRKMDAGEIGRPADEVLNEMEHDLTSHVGN